MASSAWAVALLLAAGAAVGCGGGDRPTPGEATAAPAAASQASPKKKRAELPLDPPPPAAALAGEAEALEVQLRRTDAYGPLWSVPRDELNAFLTALSEMVSWGVYFKDETPLAADRVQLAVSLNKYVLRTGALPGEFAKKLDAHLAATAGEPHLGVWGSKHDYAALAAWRQRSDPQYQREMLSARRSGWLSWREPSTRPWLPYVALEADALERLVLLDDLTEVETAQLAAARAAAKKRAPGVTRANYEKLAVGMTYAQAVALLGGPGEELSSTELGGIRTAMYSWQGDGVANMNAMFQDGKLVSKAQMGLE